MPLLLHLQVQVHLSHLSEHIVGRTRFPRRGYSGVHGFFQLVQADVAFFFKSLGYNYVLLLIDVFSQRIFTRKLETKAAPEVKRAFEEIFEEAGALPSILECDQAKYWPMNVVLYEFAINGGQAEYLAYIFLMQGASLSATRLFLRKSIFFSN